MFAIAESRGWTLLTCDGSLRELAVGASIDMHGALWLFDQSADGQHVAFDRLHDRLNTIFALPRRRLPSQEVKRRLARFASEAS